MSKILPVSVMAIGGASGAVGISYLAGAFDDPAYLSKDLGEFKSSGGGTCVRDFFPGLDLNVDDNNKKLKDSNKVTSTSFDSTNGQDREVEGCLIINWERYNYKENKWKGNFRWSWSFRNKKGDKGFVMFARAETKNESSSPQLDLTGGFYYLTKASVNNVDTWSVDRYDELTAGDKKIAKSDVSTTSNKFPKVGEAVSNPSTSKPYWGFFSADTDFDKICGSLGCTEEIGSDWFRGYWTWEHDTDVATNASKKDFSKWSTDLKGSNNDGWLVNMIDTGKLDLSNTFDQIKGEWQKYSVRTSVSGLAEAFTPTK